MPQLTFSEIALQLGITTSGAKYIHDEALKKLRETYTREEIQELFSPPPEIQLGMDEMLDDYVPAEYFEYWEDEEI